jgi:hypothetical protein
MTKPILNEQFKRMQKIAGLLTENETNESVSNSFYQDMMSANPGWNREKVMDMVKNEVDPDEEFGNEEHQEYLEDSESYFDMLQASGPTVKPGDSVEVFDKMKRKFIPGKIVKATKLKGNFMYNGNVEPNNIPAWEISDADGRKVYYPQYEEGKGFKKSNMNESVTSGLKLNLTDESNWNILYGPGGRTFQIQQIRPKTDPTAPMGDRGRKNRVGLDINVSERKNQVTIGGDAGNSIAFVKIIDGMFNSGASRIKPLGNTGAMETFITLDQLDQLAPGLYERDEVTESMKPTSKTTKKRLTAQIKEMILAEMDSSEMNDGNKTPTNPGVPNDSTDMALDMIKKGIPEAKKKSKKDEEAPEEAPEEMDAEIDAEVDTEMPMDTPEPSHTDVQKELTDALEAAKASGDEKLVRQIGNALTYFTRSQVAGEEGNMGGLNESFVKKMQRTAGIIK